MMSGVKQIGIVITSCNRTEQVAVATKINVGWLQAAMRDIPKRLYLVDSTTERLSLADANQLAGPTAFYDGWKAEDYCCDVTPLQDMREVIMHTYGIACSWSREPWRQKHVGDAWNTRRGIADALADGCTHVIKLSGVHLLKASPLHLLEKVQGIKTSVVRHEGWIPLANTKMFLANLTCRGSVKPTTCFDVFRSPAFLEWDGSYMEGRLFLSAALNTIPLERWDMQEYERYWWTTLPEAYPNGTWRNLP